MGFFDRKAICAICDKEVGLNRFKIVDGWVCPSCAKEAEFQVTNGFKRKTKDEVIKTIEECKLKNYNKALEKEKKALDKKNRKDEDARKLLEAKEIFEKFEPTREVKKSLQINENTKEWLIPKGLFSSVMFPKVRRYDEIVSFELLENGNSVTKGGLGRAVAGGLLFGGVGAIVGGVTGGKKTKEICKSMKIKITLNDINEPFVFINILTIEEKKGSMLYNMAFRSAQEILSILEIITKEVENDQVTSNSNVETKTETSSADEILKFKELMDQGIITEEEFNQKKKQLLNLY